MNSSENAAKHGEHFCSVCGTKNSPSAHFCKFCGKALDRPAVKAATSSTVPVAQQATPKQVEPQQVTPVSQVEPKQVEPKQVEPQQTPVAPEVYANEQSIEQATPVSQVEPKQVEPQQVEPQQATPVAQQATPKQVEPQQVTPVSQVEPKQTTPKQATPVSQDKPKQVAPQQVTYAAPQQVAPQQATPQQPTYYATVQKKRSNYISNILAIALMVFSIVALFSISMTAVNIDSETKAMQISNFFGIINPLNVVLIATEISNLGEMGMTRYMGNFLAAMSATAIGFIALLAMLVLAIIGIVKVVKFAKGQETHLGGTATKMAFISIATACFIGSLFSMSEVDVVYGRQYEMSNKISLFTYIVMALLVALILAYLVSRVVENVKSGQKNVVVSVFVIVGVLAVITLMFVMSMNIVNVNDFWSTNYAFSGTIKSVIFPLLTFCTGNSQSEAWLTLLGCGVLVTLAVIAILIFCVFAGSSVCSIAIKKKGAISGLVFAILAFLFSLIYVIFSFVALDTIANNNTYGIAPDSFSTNSWLAIVVSLVALASTIVTLVLYNVNKNKELKKAAMLNVQNAAAQNATQMSSAQNDAQQVQQTVVQNAENASFEQK